MSLETALRNEFGKVSRAKGWQMLQDLKGSEALHVK